MVLIQSENYKLSGFLVPKNDFKLTFIIARANQ